MCSPLRAALCSSLVSLTAAATPAQPQSSQLDWLPREVSTVFFGSAAQAALVRWGIFILAKRGNCVEDQLGSLDLYAMVSARPADRYTHLLHGRLRRDAIERCVVELFSKLGLSVEARRHGAVTEFAVGDRRSYVGWTADWAVWDNRRETVESLLAATKSSGIDPVLQRMLRRLGPCAAWMCGASVNDFTSKLLGVRSLGFLFSVELDAKSPQRSRAPLVLLFPSAGDADGALQRFNHLAHDARFSPALRLLLDGAAATVHDRELEVDAYGLLKADPDLMKEATKAVQESIAVPASK
jgi:hypothetical protein